MPPVLSKAIGAGGASVSWTGQRKNVVRIFNLFIEQDEELSTGAATTWDALSEAALCAPDVYERFAYYMLHVYEPDQRKGEEHLDGSTTRNYLAIAPSTWRATSSRPSAQMRPSASSTASTPTPPRSMPSGCAA